ncbi:MAG: hypothetical protein F6K39_35295 [Okeania sp. SIO3B3]|nr:hypothetical protein [Okeania sp. SIO3B3]
MNTYTLVAGRQRELKAEDRRVYYNCELILYTNDTTGHDISPDKVYSPVVV